MTQQLSTVAIDLAKKVFHLVGADTTGKILWRSGRVIIGPPVVNDQFLAVGRQ
jgi:hypothetical protein